MHCNSSLNSRMQTQRSYIIISIQPIVNSIRDFHLDECFERKYEAGKRSCTHSLVTQNISQGITEIVRMHRKPDQKDFNRAGGRIRLGKLLSLKFLEGGAMVIQRGKRDGKTFLSRLSFTRRSTSRASKTIGTYGYGPRNCKCLVKASTRGRFFFWGEWKGERKQACFCEKKIFLLTLTFCLRIFFLLKFRNVPRCDGFHESSSYCAFNNLLLVIIFITRFNLQINCRYIFFKQFIRDNEINLTWSSQETKKPNLKILFFDEILYIHKAIWII